jgi:NAD dependent epimerase/dehydratase family enzyme
VTVEDFATGLADALRRPSWAKAPAFVLRLTLGEAADALLASLRVVPRRAQESGYAFAFPKLKEALADLLNE